MVTSNPEKPTIELSIIILSYNTATVTKDCIESIFNSLKVSNLLYEIIVLDNASADNSVKLLQEMQEKYKHLTIIDSKVNVGFGKGNNIAVKQAEGKYLLFLNSDTIVLDRAVNELLTYYKTNEKTVHFASGKLFNPDGSSQASCGPFYSLPVVFGALFLKGDYWGLTRYSPATAKKVDWVSGACILTTKEIFNKVHGFDEKIFMYMDEIDLLYRANKQGYSTYFYPSARFVHLGSASSEGKTFPILQVYSGFLYFYKKHFNRLTLGILKGMLQLKAVVSVFIGRLTGNPYLIKTYENAYKIASMD